MENEVTKNNVSDSVGLIRTWPRPESVVTKFEMSVKHDVEDVERQYLEPGDTLYADVVIELASPLHVSMIDVELRGEASVAWKADEDRDRPRSSSSPSGRRTASAQWFQTSELYVDERQTISAGDDALSIGVHRLPVSFQLPRGLPSSFCGRFGSVMYALRASFVDRSTTSVRSLAAPRYTASEPVLVRRHAIPPDQVVLSSSSPTIVKLSRRLYAAAPFICVSGMLRVHFIVTDGVEYQLGDDIRVVVRVINDSPRVVVGVDVVLVQVCEFRAQRARRRCVALVSRRRDVNGHLAVVSGDAQHCNDFRLSVPAYLPESRLDGCDVIDISYELRFSVEVSSCRRRLRKRLPITVSSEDVQRLPRQHRAEAEAAGVELDGPQTVSPRDVTVRACALSISDESIARFRRPVRPGETKQNIAYKLASEGSDDKLND